MNAPSPDTDLSGRARRIALSGWLILLLSAGSALLPVVEPANAEIILGTLLIVAGLLETFAGSLRHETRKLSMLAGVITVLAGFLFAIEERTGFLSTLTIIAAWLFLRGIVLAAAAALERGSVRMWTGLSAAMDLALALIIVIGISIASLVVTLFGATGPLIASFAWVLALSFVVNGMMLLEIASCARQDEDV